MKRLFSFSLVVALSLLLASCGREDTASGVSDAQSAAKEAADRAAMLGINSESNEMSDAAKSGNIHKIINPTTKSVWKTGKIYTIKWESNLGGKVEITVYKWGKEQKPSVSGLPVSTPNDGNYRWKVPSQMAPDPDCKRWTCNQVHIMVIHSGSPYKIASSGYFELNKGEPEGGSGTLKVTTPNGGESWKAGKKYTIKWKKGDAGSYVKIQLLKSGKADKWISKKTKNDGKHRWKVPSTVATGSAYKIRVQSVTKSTLKDDSDSNFTIGKAGGGTLPSGDYKYLKKYNAYQLSGHTLRWKSKTIQVSGASGSWRAAVNRWRPAVRFKYVTSKPAVGKGIQIAGYANIGGACGQANWSYYSNGEMATCKVRISSNYDENSCGSEGDTIAHEIGHCIGFFKHTSDGGLMDATAACTPNCAITSPVKRMISLLYRLSPGTNINSKLSRSSGAMRRPKESKYDPAGKKIYYGSSYFLPNGVVKIVEGW